MVYSTPAWGCLSPKLCKLKHIVLRYNLFLPHSANLHLAHESDSYSSYLNIFTLIVCQLMLLTSIYGVYSHPPFLSILKHSLINYQ